ncbi:MAG: hypothetical protein KatS3mg082_0809 [Nitrospiraceae bacterium]|nr:MAG: hypothetical protein KatS3mg082_0809 [Nitrospiraceae bacterium]
MRILDTWFDRRSGQHYALAGMNRAQAESALLERIAELDQMIDTEVTEARRTQDKLARVRNLKRAAKNLVVREVYNADLRVIRASGQGHPPAYRVAELTAELEQFLAANLGGRGGSHRRSGGNPIPTRGDGGTDPGRALGDGTSAGPEKVRLPKGRVVRHPN